MRKLKPWPIALAFFLAWSVVRAGSNENDKSTTANIRLSSSTVVVQDAISGSTVTKISLEGPASAGDHERPIGDIDRGATNKSMQSRGDSIKIPWLLINDKAKGTLRGSSEPGANTSKKSASPNPRMILQGGDTFEDAVLITGIPYIDSGTTTGYTRDYTLSCASPYGEDYSGPDAVYKYIPAADDSINVSLLLSDFGTILGIFEDDTLHEIACNDDYSISGGSYIQRLPFLVGHTYYIVISGEWWGSGDYVLELFNPVTPVANHNCSDVTPQPLIAGTTLTFTGNISGYDATDDCPALVQAAFPWASELPQVWVAFTTSEWMDVELDYCGSDPAWWVGYTVVIDQCCSLFVAADGVDYALCPDGNYAMFFNDLPPGTHYYPIPDIPRYAAGQYVINVNGTAVSPPFTVECAPGSVMETEPNDGCWVDPPSGFDTISSGQTICGNSWVSGDNPRTNDIDWNLFTLTENTIVHLTALADFRCTIGILVPNSADPCDNDWQLRYSASGGLCDTIRVSVALEGPGPGVYAVIVQPGTQAQFEDGTYWLSMATEPAPPAPPNDHCGDVIPVSLIAGETAHLTGDNSYSYQDCSNNPLNWNDWPDVWEAFTISDTLNISVDFCGTDPAWADLLNGQPLYITTDCPCTWNWTMAQTWDSVACSDGNWTYGWYGLPPGTYYVPIVSLPELQHSYSMNISAEQFITPPFDTLPCPRALFTSGTTWYELGPGFYMRAAYGSQCDPTGLMNASFIDNFTIPGTGEATIDTLIFPVGWWPDENPGPGVWEGIVVSIYADNNGMPGGHPIFPDPNCGQEEDIPGGVVATQILQPGEYEVYTTGSEMTWWIHAPLDSLILTAGTTYWINIQAIQDWSRYSFSLIYGAWEVNGPPAQRYINGEWIDPALVDMAFCLIGNPVSPGCSYVPGDINGNGSANGIDVTYGVTYLKGGSAPPDSCDCPPMAFPFYGAMDVNGNCQANGIDITFFVAYLKSLQPALLFCPDCPPPGVAAAIPDVTPAVMPSIKMGNDSDTQGAKR